MKEWKLYMLEDYRNYLIAKKKELKGIMKWYHSKETKAINKDIMNTFNSELQDAEELIRLKKNEK